MTSEELNRAIEFLIQHEARMDAQQEEDKRLIQELAVNHKRMSGLIVIQSGRLDRMDQEIDVAKQRLDRAEREDQAARVVGAADLQPSAVEVEAGRGVEADVAQAERRHHGVDRPAGAMEFAADRVEMRIVERYRPVRSLG